MHLASTSALEAVRTALHFLDQDRTRSIHDKVAGPYDYEELIGALVLAEAALNLQTDDP